MGRNQDLGTVIHPSSLAACPEPLSFPVCKMGLWPAHNSQHSSCRKVWTSVYCDVNTSLAYFLQPCQPLTSQRSDNLHQAGYTPAVFLFVDRVSVH